MLVSAIMVKNLLALCLGIKTNSHTLEMINAITVLLALAGTITFIIIAKYNFNVYFPTNYDIKIGAGAICLVISSICLLFVPHKRKNSTEIELQSTEKTTI